MCLLFLKDFGGDNKNDRLGLDEILLKGYQRKGYNGSWLSDRELLYEDNQTLYIYNVDTQYRSILADSLTLVFNCIQYLILCLKLKTIAYNRNQSKE